MGLIEHMAKKGAPKGVKLPQPTTAGDDRIIAAKTGEYFLPVEVVQAIGVDKLDALVEAITGKKPGGQPAEMPEGPMHEMMEGEGMQGYALGGAISQFDGVRLNSDPLQDNRESLSKYRFDGGMGADSVATEIGRAEQGMPQADEVMGLAQDKLSAKAQKRRSLAELQGLQAMGALGEDDVLGFSKGGLISRVMGYESGGLVDDELRRRLSGYNPQASIPPNATTNASPRAPELRNYTPEPGRVQPQPANTYTRMGTEPNVARAPELRNYTPEPGRLQPGGVEPRISGLAAQAPQAPRPGVSRTVAELDARAASPNLEAAKRGVQQVQTNRLSAEAMSPGKGTIRGLAGAAVVPVAEAAGQFAIGEDANTRNQFYNDPNVGTLEKAKQFGRDAAGIALPTVGAAVGAGAGSVVAPVAGTAAGGVAGYGIGKGADSLLQSALGESALDRYKAQQPQQAPKAQPPKGNAPLAAAAPSFEQTAKFIQDERSVPAPASATSLPAAAPRPARGPVSGLAARAAKPAQSAQPAAPQIDPAVMADAQAAQAELDQSPIARVVWGSGGATIQYKDGTTKQTTDMNEVNAWNALTNRAAQQYAAQPVEVIAGHNTYQAVPELGYQQLPDAIARNGLVSQFMQGRAQGAIDRADPVAAELRAKLAEINAQGDNSIRVSNATDRGGKGRGLSNDAAQIELERKRLVADLEKQALGGDQSAVQKLNLLRGAKGDSESQKARYGLIGELSKAYASNTPFDPETKTAIPFDQWAAPMLQSAEGTVKSSSTAPQSAVQALKKDPKLAAQFDAKYGQGASAQYLNAR